MKRLLMVLILILISTASFAWPIAKQIEVRPGSVLGWDNASATWRPVRIDPLTGDLGVDAEVNIGSITVEAFPVYADSLGNVATATVDASNRAVVNIGSETIGLISAINAVAAACASETNLVTAINAITTALGNPLIVEAELATDSIGLIAAINAVEAELSDAHAAADAAATHTLAVMSYLSDSVNIVPWFTAVILGDNVNGNNQAAIAPWIFDGTTWYRRRSVPSTGIALSAEASPTAWEQQTITLVANTAQTITSEITGTRKNILLKAQEEKPFWVSIDGDAVIGTNGTLVNDWILLDVPLAVNVSVIASEAFAVSVIESGW